MRTKVEIENLTEIFWEEWDTDPEYMPALALDQLDVLRGSREAGWAEAEWERLTRTFQEARK